MNVQNASGGANLTGIDCTSSYTEVIATSSFTLTKNGTALTPIPGIGGSFGSFRYYVYNTGALAPNDVLAGGDQKTITYQKVLSGGTSPIVQPGKMLVNTNVEHKIVNYSSGTSVSIAECREGCAIINTSNIAIISNIKSSTFARSNIAGVNTNLETITSLGTASTTGISNVNVSDYDYVIITFSFGGSGAGSITITI